MPAQAAADPRSIILRARRMTGKNVPAPLALPPLALPEDACSGAWMLARLGGVWKKSARFGTDLALLTIYGLVLRIQCGN